MDIARSGAYMYMYMYMYDHTCCSKYMYAYMYRTGVTVHVQAE